MSDEFYSETARAQLKKLQAERAQLVADVSLRMSAPYCRL